MSHGNCHDARNEGAPQADHHPTDGIVWLTLATSAPCPICCSPNDCVHRERRRMAAFDYSEDRIECSECGEYWDLRAHHECAHGNAHPLFEPPRRRTEAGREQAELASLDVDTARWHEARAMGLR